jgi:hypothetical protein
MTSWQRFGGWLREMLTLPDLRSEQLHQALIDVRDREARIGSLTASLEDAHREVTRLSAEKHARDMVISEAMEKLVSLHRQEAGK